MAIEITPAVNQLRNRVENDGMGGPQSLETPAAQTDGDTFSDMIQDAIHSVDQAQKTADQNVENIVTGHSDNIHDAMISMQKARISFQLMMEIRNKAIETYQELSRMQI
jgi:flagellar hook-basal body complex protein FliE